MDRRTRRILGGKRPAIKAEGDHDFDLVAQGQQHWGGFRRPAADIQDPRPGSGGRKKKKKNRTAGPYRRPGPGRHWRRRPSARSSRRNAGSRPPVSQWAKLRPISSRSNGIQLSCHGPSCYRAAGRAGKAPFATARRRPDRRATGGERVEEGGSTRLGKAAQGVRAQRNSCRPEARVPARSATATPRHGIAQSPLMHAPVIVTSVLWSCKAPSTRIRPAKTTPGMA